MPTDLHFRRRRARWHETLNAALRAASTALMATAAVLAMLIVVQVGITSWQAGAPPPFQDLPTSP